MSALAIARAAGTRVLRDKRALFFLVVLPIVLIVVVGAVARGFDSFRVGVLDEDRTAASRQLVRALEATARLTVVTYPDRGALEKAVAREEVDAGVVVPHGLDAAERAGAEAAVAILAEPANTSQQAAAARVSAVVGAVGGEVQAAQFATRYGGSFSENLVRAAALSRVVPRVGLERRVVESSERTLPAGYEYSAPTELVLFVFLTAVAGGATIVETRRLGMYERMAAAPVRPRAIIAGESLTYLAIAAVQSALIVIVGRVAFGVSWGDPLGAGALVLAWCLVGAAAGVLAGTLFRTPEQAGAIGPLVGITFAMLGGCMWPLSIVSPTMRAVGHLTPQAWAVDAWTSLLAGHGSFATIAGELGVLALFAVAFFTAAALRLRRVVTSSR